MATTGSRQPPPGPPGQEADRATTKAPEASSRTWILRGIAVMVAVLLVLVYLGWLFPREGPLGSAGGSFYVGNVKAGRSVSLAYQLRVEDLEDAIELREVVLVGADDDLTVGDVVVIPCPSGASGCTPSAVEGWPPSRGPTVPLEGYVLPEGGSAAIAVEVQVPPDAEGKYEVPSAMLTYSKGIRRFRTELDPEITLRVLLD